MRSPVQIRVTAPAQEGRKTTVLRPFFSFFGLLRHFEAHRIVRSDRQNGPHAPKNVPGAKKVKFFQFLTTEKRMHSKGFRAFVWCKKVAIINIRIPFFLYNPNHTIMLSSFCIIVLSISNYPYVPDSTVSFCLAFFERFFRKAENMAPYSARCGVIMMEGRPGR